MSNVNEYLVKGWRICPTCRSSGFPVSSLGEDRCEFCDGTEGGVGPDINTPNPKDLEFWIDHTDFQDEWEFAKQCGSLTQISKERAYAFYAGWVMAIKVIKEGRPHEN